ncbi:hypothetical protein QF034_007770 [Streptomyces africanus]|uniref:Uncharacterized protein n=1 Tax=Streptomyces africanus TaxID=231024 RepID=A0ABU0R452_9ACTN|nr:hypothetical protein [Streptomyces africanus]MDQ0753539.1 hypothetical protein [Streptomyces africanus]
MALIDSQGLPWRSAVNSERTELPAGGAKAVDVGAGTVTTLGGQDDAVDAVAGVGGEPAADDLFAAAAAVDVGDVDEAVACVHEGVQEGVQECERLVFRGVDAEVHGAEGDAGDGGSGVAELAALHGAPCRCAAHATVVGALRRTSDDLDSPWHRPEASIGFCGSGGTIPLNQLAVVASAPA